jgi:hypothetical protein
MAVVALTCGVRWGCLAVRQSRRSAASLKWELELIEHLDEVGFLVPVPLRTVDGHFSRNGIVVQRWIDGREPVTAPDWRLVAAELVRLHRDEPAGSRTLGKPSTAGPSILRTVGGDWTPFDEGKPRIPFENWSGFGHRQRPIRCATNLAGNSPKSARPRRCGRVRGRGGLVGG